MIEINNVFVVKSPIIAEGISQLKHGLDDDILMTTIFAFVTLIFTDFQ